MRIRIATPIAAPREICFDLARDISFHMETMRHTGERVVGGRTHGLIESGETVTFEGRHFGVRQTFTSRITGMERPAWFRDEMVEGAFASFCHDHRFEPLAEGTRMIDEIAFRSPCGPVGWLIDRTVMAWYLRRLIRARADAIARRAEAVAGRT